MLINLLFDLPFIKWYYQVNKKILGNRCESIIEKLVKVQHGPATVKCSKSEDVTGKLGRPEER